MQITIQNTKGEDNKYINKISLVTANFDYNLDNRICIDTYQGSGDTFKKRTKGNELIRITKDGKTKEILFKDLFKLIK